MADHVFLQAGERNARQNFIARPESVCLGLTDLLQNCALCRISKYLITIRPVCCRVKGADHIKQLRIFISHILIHDCHTVLGKSSCLIGENDIDCSDCFARMHLLDKVIFLRHRLHRKGKRQRHRKRKTLWNGDYDNHHSSHQELYLLKQHIP